MYEDFLDGVLNAVSKPILIESFDNIDDISLEGRLQEHLKCPNERGGKIIPVKQSRRLTLRLKQTDEGVPCYMDYSEQVKKDEIGKWHTHLTDDPPLLSSQDFFFWSNSEFPEYPHLLASRSEIRLYFHRFLADLISENLRKRVVPYSAENRKQEFLSASFAKDDPELTITDNDFANICYIRI